MVGFDMPYAEYHNGFRSSSGAFAADAVQPFIGIDSFLCPKQEIVKFLCIVDISRGKFKTVDYVGVGIDSRMPLLSVDRLALTTGTTSPAITPTIFVGLGFFECRIYDCAFADN